VSVIGHYDGKLTLWAPFADLRDVPPDNSYSPVVAESEYVALRDQLKGAVARAEDAERRVEELLAAEAARFREAMMWKDRAVESGWGR
jgi:predicted component of type VI protein secretion system